MEQEGTIGVGTIALVVFVILKLTGLIGWSWWWVLSPLWIPLAILAAVLLVIGIPCLILKLFGK